jgi:hypothetical protein
MLLYAFPQEAPSVSDEDESAFVLAKSQRRKQVRREPGEIEDVLPVEPGLVQHGLEGNHDDACSS